MAHTVYVFVYVLAAIITVDLILIIIIWLVFLYGKETLVRSVSDAVARS